VNAGTLPCRSTSPDGDGCTKGRGHVRRWHQREGAHGTPSSRRWEGGVRTPARWEYVDDGHMTEADYATWGRL
jgi:hypothetical protein